MRIEWLKKDILEKLKLTAPPNITSSNTIPPNFPVVQGLFKKFENNQSSMYEEDDEDEIEYQKLICTAKSHRFMFKN